MEYINQEKMKQFAENFKKTLEDFRRSETCKGCAHNPKATKPFKKMKRIPIETEWIKRFESMDIDPSCAMCYSTKKFIEDFKTRNA